MPELIEKGKAVAYLKSRECEFSDECGKYWMAGFRAAREAIEKFPKTIPYLEAARVLREASDAPAADVAEVEHGKPIKKSAQSC